MFQHFVFKHQFDSIISVSLYQQKLRLKAHNYHLKFGIYIMLYKSQKTLWEKLREATIIKRRGEITNAMKDWHQVRRKV